MTDLKQNEITKLVRVSVVLTSFFDEAFDSNGR